MLKFIALFAALNLSVLGTLDQASNKEAKDLLEAATAKLKAHPQLYLEFNYDFVNKRVTPPVTQSEKGSIAVKGDNYHLIFMGTEQIRVGNKLYTILREDEEVQVTAYDPKSEQQGITPSSLLSSYGKGYSYKMGGSEKINNKTVQYVILKPNASEEVDKIMIGIFKDSKQLHSLKQWGTNGTEVQFTITTFAPDKKLPADYFTFKESNYPGYYISK